MRLETIQDTHFSIPCSCLGIGKRSRLSSLWPLLPAAHFLLSTILKIFGVWNGVEKGVFGHGLPCHPQMDVLRPRRGVLGPRHRLLLAVWRCLSLLHRQVPGCLRPAPPVSLRWALWTTRWPLPATSAGRIPAPDRLIRPDVC